MLDGLDLVAERLADAETARSEGDSARKRGDEKGALDAFTRGVTSLDEVVGVLEGPPWNGFRDASAEPDADTLNDLVEALGTRGGFLKRLGDLKSAHASYEAGAALERRFHLSSTYNRLNAVKGAIRLGTRLAALLPAIREIAETLADLVDRDPEARQRGWTWADLADCRALLGDVPEAATAYQQFIELSETQSPSRALEELRDLYAVLRLSEDPDAPRVDEAVTLLAQRLQGAAGPA